MMRLENEDNSSVADDQENFETQSSKSSKKGTIIVCCLSFFLGISMMIASVYVLSTDVPPFHEQLELKDILPHLESLQKIAYNNSGRSPSNGYNASVDHFIEILNDYPKYFTVKAQHFPLKIFKLTSPAVLSYQEDDEKEIFFDKLYYEVLKFSGSGKIEGVITLANNSGCDFTDFPSVSTGRVRVALVWRGNCNFDKKAINAQGAGYSALLIANNRPGSFTGTLGAKEIFTIPVLGVSDEIGDEISQFSDDESFIVKVNVNADISESISSNLIAETIDGDEKETIVIGAHLDSIEGSYGINDNGSGSAALLAIAVKFAQRKVKLQNKIVFGWWGAEEDGLIGSEHYVDTLYEEKIIQNIKANINADMIASPNYIRGVYNGSTADENIQEKSIGIQKLFELFFEEHELEYELTPLNGRSDYASFVEQGIPVGGVFGGSDGVKTNEQRQKFGGIIGAAYDPCYHRDCDTIDNINEDALMEMTKALAFVLYEMSTSDLEKLLTKEEVTP